MRERINKKEEDIKITNTNLLEKECKKSENFNNNNSNLQNTPKKQSFASTFKKGFEKSTKNNSTSKYLLNEGLEFYNNGEYKKAINCFQIVLELEPNNTECKRQLLEITKKLDDNNQITNWEKDNLLLQVQNDQEELDFKDPGSDLHILPNLDLDLDVDMDIDMDIENTIKYPPKDECYVKASNEYNIPTKDYSEDFTRPIFTEKKVLDKLSSRSSITDTNYKPQRAKKILAKKNERKNFGKTFENLLSTNKDDNEGVAIFNLEGNLVLLNTTFAAMHGYSPEKLIGKHLSTFHTNDQIPVVEAANGQIIKNGEYTGELLHMRSNGTVFPILTHKSLLTNDSGIPVGVIGTYQEVSNLKISEAEIKKLNFAAQQSLDGIAIFDLESKLTYVNEAFASMHGYSPQEMLGMKVEQIYNKDQVEIFKKRMNYTQDKGLWAGEMGCIRKDGTAFPLHLSVTMIKDDLEKPKGIFFIARDIIERDREELIVQEVNKNLDNIICTIHEPLIVLDDELKIVTINESFQKTFKLTQAQTKGQVIYNLANHQWNIPKLYELLEDILPKKKSINNFEIEYNFPLIGQRVMLFNARLISRGVNKGQMILLAMEDITDRKHAEEELMWRLMKFKIENGKVYLAKEFNSSLSIEAFKDLLRVGYNGLVISRTPEKDFKKGVINNNCEFIWLAEKGQNKSLPPKLNDLEFQIESVTRKTVILIERGDYLIFKNGFKKTLSFIHRLREIAYLTGNIVIVSFDPATLNTQELCLLEKECAVIEPRLTKKKIPEKQLKILRCVYEENLIGRKPTYTVIGQETGISKPTARKRIRILIAVGYVMESIKGRNKVLELTEMGKSLFQN